MNALALSFLAALCAGIFLGAIYDTVRISRIFLGVSYTRRGRELYKKIHLPVLSKHETDILRRKGVRKEGTLGIALDIAIFIGDILFCFFSAIVCVVILYHTNDGKARWITFFGMAAGFSAYYFTLGRLVMLFSEYIVFAFRCMAFFITLPMRRLIVQLHRAVEYIKIKRYTEKEIKRILNASKIGFIG